MTTNELCEVMEQADGDIIAACRGILALAERDEAWGVTDGDEPLSILRRDATELIRRAIALADSDCDERSR